jgi:hypothetical protein
MSKSNFEVITGGGHATPKAKNALHEATRSENSRRIAALIEEAFPRRGRMPQDTEVEVDALMRRLGEKVKKARPPYPLREHVK